MRSVGIAVGDQEGRDGAGTARPGGLLLGYARLTEREIGEGIERLAAVISGLDADPRTATAPA